MDARVGNMPAQVVDFSCRGQTLEHGVLLGVDYCRSSWIGDIVFMNDTLLIHTYLYIRRSRLTFVVDTRLLLQEEGV